MPPFGRLVSSPRPTSERSGTLDSLAAIVKGELDELRRTVERILKTGPADTVIPYTCLIELYQTATAKPAEGRPTEKGTVQTDADNG